MSLKDLVKKDIVGEFEYPGIEDFKVKLRYLSRDEMKKIMETCSIKRFDPRSKQTREDLDSEKFKRYTAENIVVSWKGLTYAKLSKLVILDLESMKAAGIKDTDEFEPTVANKTELLSESLDFDNWVAEMMKETTNFSEAKKADDLKN